MGLFDRFRTKKTEPVQQEAEQSQHEDSGIVLGFVLLDSLSCDFNQFLTHLNTEWNVQVKNTPDEETFVFEVGHMKVACAYLPAPIPNNEVEECCKFNLLWPDAEQVVSKHQAHVIVTVMGATDPIEAHVLFTQVTSSLLQLDNALAIYMAPMVMSAEYYIKSAAMLKENELPVQLWVFIGLYHNQQQSSSYTRGMRKFGKEELEIIQSQHSLGDVFEFMMVITSYIIGSNVTLRSGETIGFTADQRLPLTLSQGSAVEGNTLKVGF
ncbi:MAG: DUF4261 domain-containing protein [Candidatus Pristimantibacillus sp.]